ncbi:NACHT domain-containing protein [Sphingobacteriales bacterium UPWRP_1]|nr:hypothetical protein B6N25_14675 [Sphingobacteriales bacterium TSM_CSS]PSJ78944.1 NACHT domain-containing protein [Sphingobacteriales bacterium UPWRP_1]
MDAALFEKLLSQTESETLDFKREFYSLANDMAKSELVKDILSFYNTPRTANAYIIIGVEDKNGVPVLPPVGMKDKAPYDEATIQEMVKDKASPCPVFSLAYFDDDGKHFAAITIPLPLTDKPARVVKDFGKLKQNELWCRVGSSSKNMVAVDDLRRVEDYFAERKTYVQLQAYTEKLAADYAGKTIMQEDKMTLADVYIEPMFGVYKECWKKDEKEQYFHKLFTEQKETLHLFINEWVQNRQINTNINVINGNVILLLGNPGQGKTSLCKRLLHDYFSKYSEQLLEKPIFRIQFRNLTDVERLIANPLPILFDHLKSIVPEVDRNLFNKSLLVLDGLDELMITERLTYNSIDQFCRNLLRSAENMEMKILITSRYHVDIEKLKNDCLVLNISLLTLQQQQDWLQKYQKFHPECELTLDLLERFNKNYEYKHISELIDQPILLHMLASTFTGKDEDIAQYANRAKVYDNLFTQLIERKWAKERQIEALKGLNQKDMRRLLQEVAMAIFLSGREYLHKTELEALITEKKLLQNAVNLQLQQGSALKGLMMAAYMQETEKLSAEEKTPDDLSNYGIEFLHKSLQEYLTAEKMWTEVLVGLTKTKKQGGYEIGYEINMPDEVLKIFHNLFGMRALTKEIAAALRQIIALQPQEARTKLADRMEHFLPLLLQHDFLYEYSSSSIKPYGYPINMAIQTCYGFWWILTHLVEKRDYLGKLESRERLLFPILNFAQTHDCIVPFSYQNLRSINFTGVNFTGVDLTGANLIGVDLTGANLTGANLTGTNLAGANLSHVILKDFNIDIHSVILIEVNLAGAYLLNVNLSGVDLTCANFNHANLIGLNLSNTTLNGAKLEDATFRESNLSGADLNNAILCRSNLIYCNLSCANLSHANLAYANLSNCDLSHANLSHANLVYANLSNSNLSHANLSHANLENANLSNCDLSHANLSESNLKIYPYIGYKQLAKVKTLYGCKGLHHKIHNQLLGNFANLFEENIGP